LSTVSSLSKENEETKKRFFLERRRLLFFSTARRPDSQGTPFYFSRGFGSREATTHKYPLVYMPFGIWPVTHIYIQYGDRQKQQQQQPPFSGNLRRHLHLPARVATHGFYLN
jgi:hypothetical protein